MTQSQLAITPNHKIDIMKTEVFHSSCYTIRDAVFEPKIDDQIDLIHTFIPSVIYGVHPPFKNADSVDLPVLGNFFNVLKYSNGI